MSWGLTESILFYAMLTVQERKFEKEQRLIKTQKFYQQCYEEISAELEKAVNISCEVTERASSIYSPSDMVDGLKLLPLFCFEKVIQRQRNISNEQRRTMELYFTHFDYGFSISDFSSGAIQGTGIERFKALMNLTESIVGSFWINLFRAFCKAGSQQEYQAFCDSVTATIMRFAVLGNFNNTVAIDICKDFLKCANEQIKNVLNLGGEVIDWFCTIPVEKHISEVRRLFSYLVDHSGIKKSVNGDTLMELFEMMFLHTVCDLVMLTNKPADTKLNMIQSSLAEAGIVPLVSPKEYVEGIAKGSEAGKVYKQYFAVGANGGSFWRLITTMSGNVSDQKAGMLFVTELISMFVHIEDYLTQNYQPLGMKKIAKEYGDSILAAMTGKD